MQHGDWRADAAEAAHVIIDLFLAPPKSAKQKSFGPCFWEKQKRSLSPRRASSRERRSAQGLVVFDGPHRSKTHSAFPKSRPLFTETFRGEERCVAPSMHLEKIGDCPSFHRGNASGGKSTSRTSSTL